MVTVRVEIDQTGVFNMVRTFTTQLHEAEMFALNEIERVIRFDIFDEVIFRLGERAGDGWPRIYSSHLSEYMKIFTVIQTSTSEGRISIGFDLDNLGDYSDLERSAHHRAIINPGGDTFIRNLARVELPYNQEPLFSKSSRTEFWEQVIIGRDMEYGIGLRRGNREMVAGDLGEIPEFAEIAAARVDAWVEIGRAPQWLWLENGFNESTPQITPVDFTRTIELVTECVASRIYEGAMRSLIKVAEQAGQAVGVGSRGRPYQPSTGRFITYRETLDKSVPDYSGCLGTI